MWVVVSVKNNGGHIEHLFKNFVQLFLMYIDAVGGCNLAQLTAWALYFDHAALRTVHYFAKRCSYTWIFLTFNYNSYLTFYVIT